MKIDDVASDVMLGEHPDHGRHTTDRSGIGAEVMDDQRHTACGIGARRTSTLGKARTAATISAAA